MVSPADLGGMPTCATGNHSPLFSILDAFPCPPSYIPLPPRITNPPLTPPPSAPLPPIPDPSVTSMQMSLFLRASTRSRRSALRAAPVCPIKSKHSPSVLGCKHTAIDPRSGVGRVHARDLGVVEEFTASAQTILPHVSANSLARIFDATHSECMHLSCHFTASPEPVPHNNFSQDSTPFAGAGFLRLLFNLWNDNGKA